MSDVETRFHEQWLGMVQPVEGLVVSIPVLVDAQCMQRQPTSVQETLLELCPPVKNDDGERVHAISDLPAFFAQLLGHSADYFDAGAAIASEVSLYVPEGKQLLRPTLALKRDAGGSANEPPRNTVAEDTDAAKAAAPYVALVWELPLGLDFDKPEVITGPWEYEPMRKFDRLLRHCRVPIGILTNRTAVRLVYAPHGESTGSITFRIDDMATVGGRPILDALVMLLSATRFFLVSEERSLPAMLASSRRRQADVTHELAEQVLEAVQILLRGLEAAAHRDRSSLLAEAVNEPNDHAYGALLTVLLRVVFLLYAEDRGLLPTGNDTYAEHYSVLALFDQLQADAGTHPDSMSRRFGAWDRLLATFRAVYFGLVQGDLRMPARGGELFDPGRFPFIEGWPLGEAVPFHNPADRASLNTPSVDDETVFRMLERLLILRGQRLAYRSLDVEQIGSVYEGLMGFHVVQVASSAVRVKVQNKGSAARAWVEVAALLEQTPAQRKSWLESEVCFDAAQAKKIADAVKHLGSGDEPACIEILLDVSSRRRGERELHRAPAGGLVLQPGTERRRTSSHYTPRSLTSPIVKKTLEPLIACMGDAPSAERLLNLKICDPAMGSGAFLVEACRYLADEVVKAWTREENREVAGEHDPVMVARRLVAQRCLYGVDKNPFAVNLAKLALWLETLAQDLPFTFVDHALRHGDSLVGLGFNQLRSFHWKPGKQLELCERELEIEGALDEAVKARQRILEWAWDQSPGSNERKKRELDDAEDAIKRVRLMADVVVGAFFAKEKDKDREKERLRRLDLVARWVSTDGDTPEELQELEQLQKDLRDHVPAFHWTLEFPEIFYLDRPDPLDDNQVNRRACMDAFVGNPPFLGGRRIREEIGDAYTEWLPVIHGGGMNADLSAHFFRRTAVLLGDHGTLGLIATNTVAQGDTRDSGLKALLNERFVIYDSTRSMPWPGDAAVAVSVVHAAKGNPAEKTTTAILDGFKVPAINSRLRGSRELPDPVKLKANAGLSFQGSIVLGMGFTLTPEERDALINKNPRNAERIFPYIGGEEVNTSPTQSFHRYVINFGQMSLEEASQWPDLLAIVREKVKPERDKVNRASLSKYWWRYADPRPGLYSAIAPLDRCLVTSRVSKHLVFSFQPTDRVFAESMNVFPLDAIHSFGTIQSRVHEHWARLLSSSMRSDLRYGASDCFETFPFPSRNPRALNPELERIGTQLYDARATYMLETNQGLTTTYNHLKDPAETDPRILAIRTLHEQLDAAVLKAYGWTHIQVPPYCPKTPADHLAQQTFESQTLDHLFQLNTERAAEERGEPLPTKKSPHSLRPLASVSTAGPPRLTAVNEQRAARRISQKRSHPRSS